MVTNTTMTLMDKDNTAETEEDTSHAQTETMDLTGMDGMMKLKWLEEENARETQRTD